MAVDSQCATSDRTQVGHDKSDWMCMYQYEFCHNMDNFRCLYFVKNREAEHLAGPPSSRRLLNKRDLFSNNLISNNLNLSQEVTAIESKVNRDHE